MNARADVDVQDSKSGKTALHHSVEKGDLPMAGYLITEVSEVGWKVGAGKSSICLWRRETCMPIAARVPRWKSGRTVLCGLQPVWVVLPASG